MTKWSTNTLVTISHHLQCSWCLHYFCPLRFQVTYRTRSLIFGPKGQSRNVFIGADVGYPCGELGQPLQVCLVVTQKVGGGNQPLCGQKRGSPLGKVASVVCRGGETLVGVCCHSGPSSEEQS